MSIRPFHTAAILSALAAACATAPVPHEQLAASQGAIRAAEETGADKVPAATLYLQMAKEASDKAQKCIQRDENHRAQLLLERAEADAELAFSLAREAPLRAEAQKALDTLQELKKKANPS